MDASRSLIQNVGGLVNLKKIKMYLKKCILECAFVAFVVVSFVKLFVEKHIFSSIDKPLADHRTRLLNFYVLRYFQEKRNNSTQSGIVWGFRSTVRERYLNLLRLLYPYDVKGMQKIRVGGVADGGYVMLEPKKGEIAYSFGVSDYSPWDTELAFKEVEVYQYDGTIDKSPFIHKNIHFFKNNISGCATPKENEKNISQILRENGHLQEKNIILQMDIEGSEWSFFENITESEMMQFKQIIVEFHDFANASRLDVYESVFKKISKTHQAVHFHCNNNGSILAFDKFCICSLIEVSFVRFNDYDFVKSDASYPSCLDAPSVAGISDVYIGDFGLFS